MQHDESKRVLVRTVERYERDGLGLGNALRTIVIDPSAGWIIRGEAARVLAISEDGAAAEYLLQQFFSQEGKDELWETALTLEHLGDVGSVRPLIDAVSDMNYHRRHAAARALGWIRKPGSRAVSALINALTDASQPLAVREEAAESLAYLDSSRAIPPLISILTDPEVRIRFWAVFALGSIRNHRTLRHADRRVVSAMEAMLSDHAVPPGNWWPVAREALAMLGQLDPPEEGYRDQFVRDIQRVVDDPNSSQEDRRWAECYFAAAGSLSVRQ
ncbi:MAG TPA: HEAT repeat domain-containing protein [Bryobacteraceae bacterium]|nr:HEAT repeat domain-containing protein [Bryobacteraceae bacterium]